MGIDEDSASALEVTDGVDSETILSDDGACGPGASE